MRSFFRGLALVAVACLPIGLGAGPAWGQTINTSFGFQLYNRSGAPATITLENQGQTATAAAGGTGRVSSLPFVSYANASTAYYRIVIRSEGQVVYNGVHEVTYNYRKTGFAPALEQLFCLQANASRVAGRIEGPRITQQGNSCLYEFTLR
ncbi:hypothetical protein [Falsiroseomonas sp.]|uniref:hypothetical protein n=1 Tax=Falsiroseomonas sp. TaxID=2870721 RepID=UPI003F715115